MRKYALDLTQYHFTKARGDLTLFGTWYGDRLRPCLVVVPTQRISAFLSRPLVIEVDDAWRWNPDDPDAEPEHNSRMIGDFLRASGMDDSNVFTRMRVASLVHDHLGDLLRIPPKPVAAVVVADAIQTDRETGKVTHREIIDRV